MACNHVHQLDIEICSQNDHKYKCDRRPDYMSLYYHRSQARSANKACWSISREEESRRFYCSYDNGNSSASYPGLWHIENENIPIGENDELIAFFPEPANDNEPWHGFPFTFGRASPLERIKAIKQVAEKLFVNSELSLKRITKIRKGAL